MIVFISKTHFRILGKFCGIRKMKCFSGKINVVVKKKNILIFEIHEHLKRLESLLFESQPNIIFELNIICTVYLHLLTRTRK